MSVVALDRPTARGAGDRGDGGLAARRAVARWAWRLFRREWRQQLLVLALIVVAVAATVVGATVASNTPAPVAQQFGTAHDLTTLQGPVSQVNSQIAALEHRFGRVDVIENQAFAVPGSIETYDLRAQDPHGPYGAAMLSLVRGHYPTSAGQVALTGTLASTFGVKVGQLWREGGTDWHVVGMVTNPLSLLDQFALVVPGQVTHPTEVTVLFDARGASAAPLNGINVQTASGLRNSALNPETLSLAGITVGMLLIALVAVGGFTVLAQRRLRSLGMLASLGATDKNVGLVVRVNGAVVGMFGALVGTALGLVLWLAYRPRLETSAHHEIGMFAVPWLVVVVAMVLAVVATYLAATRPARSITKIPIVTALSGRPAPPRESVIRRYPALCCS